MSDKMTILYFAQLAEEAGKESELVEAKYNTLSELYSELQKRYLFTLKEKDLRVSKNCVFCCWSDNPVAGDEIAFIPPVAGG